jgi:AcrR family transcriptional regulator
VEGPRGGHRQRQAEETRLQIARAARTLFADRGYAATTIAAIADEADIPAPTIYSAFGSKAKILEKITRIWMTDAQTVSIAEASLAEPDPAEQLRMFAELNRRQLEVGSDVIAIYQEAARSDPQMAAVLQRVLASREGEIKKLVRALKPHLKPGLSVDAALDACLALSVPEIYRTLVERDWTPRRYQDWLGDLLVEQLLVAE